MLSSDTLTEDSVQGRYLLLFSGTCCRQVRVSHGSDTSKAYAVHPEVYQSYYRQRFLKNGYVYYVSSDRHYAIYRHVKRPSNGVWYVGNKGDM